MNHSKAAKRMKKKHSKTKQNKTAHHTFTTCTQSQALKHGRRKQKHKEETVCTQKNHNQNMEGEEEETPKQKSVYATACTQSMTS
jgi:hypothetical protein